MPSPVDSPKKPCPICGELLWVGNANDHLFEVHNLNFLGLLSGNGVTCACCEELFPVVALQPFDAHLFDDLEYHVLTLCLIGENP